MTDSEIKFFLNLKKQTDESSIVFLLSIIFFAVDGLFDFIPNLDAGFSLGIAIMLSFNFVRVRFRMTTTAQCCDLIEKLISRDVELIKRVNEHKNI